MARTKLKLKSIATGNLPGALKIATENIPDSAITTAKIANDAVTKDKVENSLNHTVLLDTFTDASGVDTSGDREIHDWASHAGTYSKFRILTRCLNVGDGNFHLYQTYRCVNGNQPSLTGNVRGWGMGSNDRALTNGSGSWFLIGYRCPQNYTIVTDQLISNDDFGLTYNEELYTIRYTTTWHQDGSGQSWAEGTVENTSQTSPISKFLLNSDPADTGAGSNHLWRVKSYLWGIV